MNPIVESLTGLKALNDKYITADMQQDCTVRIQLLTQCLTTTAHPALRQDLTEQLRVTINQQERLLQYSRLKQWTVPDEEMQWIDDLKQAYKAVRML